MSGYIFAIMFIFTSFTPVTNPTLTTSISVEETQGFIDLTHGANLHARPLYKGSNIPTKSIRILVISTYF